MSIYYQTVFGLQQILLVYVILYQPTVNALPFKVNKRDGRSVRLIKMLTKKCENLEFQMWHRNLTALTVLFIYSAQFVEVSSLLGYVSLKVLHLQ